MTVWLCASLLGEKRKPFVIGKSKNPRCFKNIEMGNFNYTGNNNA